MAISAAAFEKLVGSLEATGILVQNLLQEVRETSNICSANHADIQNILDNLKLHKEILREHIPLKTEIQYLHENFKVLAKIVRDGNGQKSILSRLDIIENSFQSIEEWVNSQQSEQSTAKVENAKGYWQVIGIIVTGLLGLAATLISLLK